MENLWSFWKSFLCQECGAFDLQFFVVLESKIAGQLYEPTRRNFFGGVPQFLAIVEHTPAFGDSS